MDISPQATPPGEGPGQWNVDEKGSLKFKGKEYQVKPLKKEDDTLSRLVSEQPTTSGINALTKKLNVQHSSGLQNSTIMELETGEKFEVTALGVTRS